MKNDLNTQLIFIRMRIAGKPLAAIAAAVGISLPTASRWNKMFKADIAAAKGARVEALRQKIVDKYSSYFDFLDSQLEKIKAEIVLHDEISMTYEKCIKNSIKILEAQNRLNIFRKLSYTPFNDDSPEIPVEDPEAAEEAKAEEEKPEEAKPEEEKPEEDNSPLSSRHALSRDPCEFVIPE